MSSYETTETYSITSEGSELLGFYCATCGVECGEERQFKSHYRSDLHYYNMKRKIVNLPPVSEDYFHSRKYFLTQR